MEYKDLAHEEQIAKFLKELEEVHFSIPSDVSTAIDIGRTLYLINELVRVCGSLYVKQHLPDSTLEELLDSFANTDSFISIEANFITSESINGIPTLPSLILCI